MLQRPQHRLGERLFGFDHVADVVEGDAADRQFFGTRTRQWPNHFEGTDKIFLRDLRRITGFGRPRRRSQGSFTAERREVGDHESGCARGDGVEFEGSGGHAAEQEFEQRLAGCAVRQGKCEFSIAEILAAKARVDGLRMGGGRDECHARGGCDGAAQLFEDQCGHRFRGGRKQSVDVTDQQYTTAAHGSNGVDDSLQAGIRLGGTDSRAVEFDQFARGQDRAGQRGFAYAGGARDEDAEVRGRRRAYGAVLVRRVPGRATRSAWLPALARRRGDPAEPTVQARSRRRPDWKQAHSVSVCPPSRNPS